MPENLANLHFNGKCYDCLLQEAQIAFRMGP